MKTISRLFKLIEYIGDSQNTISISTAAEDLDIPPSGIHRLLSGLIDLGYCYQDGADYYHLTLKIAGISAKILNNFRLNEVARPFIARLGKETGEAIHLGILENDEIVYIDKIEGSSKLRMASVVGERVPCHATALGKIHLAFLQEKEVWKIIGEKGLEARTEKTIVDATELLEHLKEVRRLGYSIDNEENEPGIQCIAVPIFDYQQKIIGAVSVSGSIYSIQGEKLKGIIKLTIQTGKEISATMGYKKNHFNE